MPTPYVPLIVVLPRHDYEYLAEHFAPVELPHELRQVISDNGWTQEQIMFGHALTAVVQQLRQAGPPAETTQVDRIATACRAVLDLAGVPVTALVDAPTLSREHASAGWEKYTLSFWSNQP